MTKKAVIESFSSPTSSNVAGARYDKATKTLEVDFHRSGTYVYSQYPPTQWEQFKAAMSKGTFFSQHVKPKYLGVKRVTLGVEITKTKKLEDLLRRSL